MSENMKRKQFHLSVAEEKMLYRLAEQDSVSEAEIVRTAIRELADKRFKQDNSLVEMAHTARASETKNGSKAVSDLSENHDQYLQEAYEEQS